MNLRSILFLLLLACNNAPAVKQTAAEKQSDSLMQEVMKAHNVGMAKMNKIDEIRGKVTNLLDSISKLPANMREKLAGYEAKVRTIEATLNTANSAMEKWMREFNMDSFANDHEKRSRYLESEKMKIATVNDSMVASIQTADSLLR